MRQISATRHLMRAAEDAVRSIYANWTNPEHHCAGNRLRMACEETERWLAEQDRQMKAGGHTRSALDFPDGSCENDGKKGDGHADLQ